MKLRWKIFFILLAFSLIPLAALTAVSQRGANRMGLEIAEEARRNLDQLANGILQLSAENSAAIVEHARKSIEFALSGLAREAEAVFAEEPPGSVKVFFAPDFDDPATAPADFGPQLGYIKKSDDGSLVNQSVSFTQPVFLLAPGVTASDAAEDIDRLSLLNGFFAETFAKLGASLHWVYVSTESGVHVSFPGHGGYPAEYDPRQRPWYRDATDEIRWSPPLVDATTGQVIMTAFKQLRYPDGSRCGVAAMDVLLTEALRIEALSSLWTAAMRSFLVRPVLNPETRSIELLVLAQKDYQTQAASWLGSVEPERLTAEDPRQLTQLVKELGSGRAGCLEMPYQGVASIWAFAPIEADAAFLIVVPKDVIDRLPQKTLAAIQASTNEKLQITAVAALAAILLAVFAALAGSRRFTRPMAELADAAARLGRGDFSVRVLTRTGDERDQVIQAFNDMVPELEDRLRMRESLLLATEVQQNLLPREAPSAPGLDIAGVSLYCDETGGDYFDFLGAARVSAGPVAVVVGDVSGHGVHAALLMASARAAVRLRASLPGSPAEIVADVNRRFAEDVGETGAFMTLFYLAVDGDRKKARWVRAGHDPAIYYMPGSGRFEEFGGRGAPLGVDEAGEFEEREKTGLETGGVIFIGTDGIWETAGPDGRLFGKQGLLQLIRTHCHLSARDIVQVVLQALEAHRQGLKPSDDITMAVVKLI